MNGAIFTTVNKDVTQFNNMAIDMLFGGQDRIYKATGSIDVSHAQAGVDATELLSGY